MIVMRSGADAETPRSQHVNAKGDIGWATAYFGAKSVTDPGTPAEPPVGVFHPTAYLIEVGAGFVSYPHFHVADQFQVFVGGSGTLGTHELGGITVHYTSAYSPYGPICAGPDGTTWFTLRNSWDSKLHYMPESREELRRSGRRPRTATEAALEPLGDGALTRATDATCSVLFPFDEDGLGAWQHRVPPGAMVTDLAPNSGGGQYWLVLGGEGVVVGKVVPRFGFVFLAPDDPPIAMTAGARGLEVLALQFPTLRASEAAA